MFGSIGANKVCGGVEICPEADLSPGLFVGMLYTLVVSGGRARRWVRFDRLAGMRNALAISDLASVRY